jgi:hypothetical protein
VGQIIMSNKVFLDLSLSISIEVNEDKKKDMLNEISATISKLLSNKDIITTNISIDSTDDDSIMLSMLLSSNIIES